MKKHFRPLLLLTLCLSRTFTLYVEVRLPAIIGSHMVLQQNSVVKILGWYDANEKIKVKADWDTNAFSWNKLIKGLDKYGKLKLFKAKAPADVKDK